MDTYEKTGDGSYAEQLRRLDGFFPNTELLTQKNICAITGLSRKCAYNNFKFPGKYISKPELARMLAEMGRGYGKKSAG